MERERFDGADVAHLFLKCGARIDWEHLLHRFEADWRVLLSHLLLFGFIYPSRKDLVPRNVMDKLLAPSKFGTADRLARSGSLQRHISLQSPISFRYRDGRVPGRTIKWALCHDRGANKRVDRRHRHRRAILPVRRAGFVTVDFIFPRFVS